MKHKKLFALLALVMTAMTASAVDEPTYPLTPKEIGGKGTITFKVDNNVVTEAPEGATVTLTVAAPDGLSVGSVTGIWNAVIAAARNRAMETSLEKDITLTSAGENTWTFTMERAEAEISVKYAKIIQESWIQDIDAVTYTGSALTPAVVVKDGDYTLVEGTDYTVSYSNNVNAAEATAGAKAPTVTVTAIPSDKYSGTASKTFTINKAESRIEFNPSQYTKQYGDPDFTVVPTVVGEGTLIYSSNMESVATVGAFNGTVKIHAVGKAIITALITSSNPNYNSATNWYEVNVIPRTVDYEGGTISQDEDGYTVTLTEDAGHPNPDPLPDDADLAELTYNRTLEAPGSAEGSGEIQIDGEEANLYTVCLPFAPETGTAAKYYTLSSVSGKKVDFDEVAEPVANTPYLVAVFGTVDFNESCSDLDVSSMTINSTTVDGYTFNGTFTGMTNADAQGKYILQSGNKWGKVTAEKSAAFIPPFRAFIEGPASGARLLSGSIDGSDGNATGIKYIRTQDIDGTERYFDLNGRRIEKPATKGVYIQNGKKTVIK